PAGHVEAGVGLDLSDLVLGDDAGVRPGAADGDLHLQPLLELVLLAPDGLHLGAGVAIDHGAAFSNSEGLVAVRCQYSGRRPRPPWDVGSGPRRNDELRSVSPMYAGVHRHESYPCDAVPALSLRLLA